MNRLKLLKPKKDPKKDKRILKRLKEQGLDLSTLTTKF